MFHRLTKQNHPGRENSPKFTRPGQLETIMSSRSRYVNIFPNQDFPDPREPEYIGKPGDRPEEPRADQASRLRQLVRETKRGAK